MELERREALAGRHCSPRCLHGRIPLSGTSLRLCFAAHLTTCGCAATTDILESAVRKCGTTAFPGDPARALAGYAARGPLALSRLSLASNGQLVYPLKAPRADGTTHVVFSPRSFLTRLSWLLVQPRSHLTRYHGVLAPNHAWRSLIVLKPPVKRRWSSPGAAVTTGPPCCAAFLLSRCWSARFVVANAA
jgi:hypothetical protein